MARSRRPAGSYKVQKLVPSDPNLAANKHIVEYPRDATELMLSDAKLVSLPESIGLLTSLTKLELFECTSLVSLPERIGDLTSLTELNLYTCRSLVSLPKRIGDLTSLTKLELFRCESLKSPPESIGQLKSLTELNLNLCKTLVSLPKGIGDLTSLTELNLSSCYALQSLPDSIGNLTSLTELNLNSCWELKSLPKRFGECKALKTLNLGYCKKLVSLPDSIGNLTKLEKLWLNDCESLVSLPERFGECKSLTKLVLSFCKLKSLPDRFGECKSLTKLDLSYCRNLKSLPERIGDLTSLTELKLGDCWKLASLPERFGECKSLTKLDLTSCKNLKSLPEGIGDLTSLTKLNLQQCYSLVSLPERIGQLVNLDKNSMEEIMKRCEHMSVIPSTLFDHPYFGTVTELNLSHWKMDKLPDSIGDLTSLTSLDLSSCKSLVSLPERLGECKSLTSLNLEHCESLVSLPDSFGKLVNLDRRSFLAAIQHVKTLPEDIVEHPHLRDATELDLIMYANLVSLPKSIGHLKSLTKLNLSNCRSLVSLPESIGDLESLTQLNLFRCESLKSLPESIGDLTNLQTLNLYGSYSNQMKLESLPDSIGDLKKSLTKLDLCWCESLTSLPERFGELDLKKLALYGCKALNMDAEINKIVEMKNLTELNIGSTNISVLSDSIGGLTSLSKLFLHNCRSLVSLPERFGDLTSLTELDLRRCTNLVSLPERFGQCKSLKSLDLSGCSNLVSLSEGFGELESLQMLEMRDCPAGHSMPDHLQAQLRKQGCTGNGWSKKPCVEAVDITQKLQKSLKKAEKATCIVGPFSAIAHLASDANHPSVLVLGEIHDSRTEEGWFNDGDDKKINAIHLLLAAAALANRDDVCFDIYLEDYLEDYPRHGFPDPTGSMLYQAKQELSSCVELHPTTTERRNCIVGCKNVRVHYVDARRLLTDTERSFHFRDLINRSEGRHPGQFLEWGDPELKILDFSVKEWLEWFAGFSESEEKQTERIKDLLVDDYDKLKFNQWYNSVFKVNRKRIRKREQAIKDDATLEKIRNAALEAHIFYNGALDLTPGYLNFDKLDLIQCDYYLLLRLLGSYKGYNRRCSATQVGGSSPRHAIFLCGHAHGLALIKALRLLSNPKQDVVLEHHVLPAFGPVPMIGLGPLPDYRRQMNQDYVDIKDVVATGGAKFVTVAALLEALFKRNDNPAKKKAAKKK